MIPNLLSALSSKTMRSYFFKIFKNENVKKTYAKSVWMDSKAIIYDRYVEYGYDRVELTDAGGNYNGQAIRTMKSQLFSSMYERKMFYQTMHAGDASI